MQALQGAMTNLSRAATIKRARINITTCTYTPPPPHPAPRTNTRDPLAGIPREITHFVLERIAFNRDLQVRRTNAVDTVRVYLYPFEEY